MLCISRLALIAGAGAQRCKLFFGRKAVTFGSGIHATRVGYTARQALIVPAWLPVLVRTEVFTETASDV